MLSSKEKNKIVTTCSLGEYCPFCALGETKGWWKKTAPSSTFQELFDVEKNGYQEMVLVKGCWHAGKYYSGGDGQRAKSSSKLCIHFKNAAWSHTTLLKQGDKVLQCSSLSC